MRYSHYLEGDTILQPPTSTENLKMSSFKLENICKKHLLFKKHKYSIFVNPDQSLDQSRCFFSSPLVNHRSSFISRAVHQSISSLFLEHSIIHSSFIVEQKRGRRCVKWKEKEEMQLTVEARSQTSNPCDRG